MALRIEIVGDSPTAQRMLRQMSSLKEFEVARVPERPARVIDRPRPRGNTTIAVVGRCTGSVIVHEDPASGEIEALPVVTLGVTREASGF